MPTASAMSSRSREWPETTDPAADDDYNEDDWNADDGIADNWPVSAERSKQRSHREMSAEQARPGPTGHMPRHKGYKGHANKRRCDSDGC